MIAAGDGGDAETIPLPAAPPPPFVLPRPPDDRQPLPPAPPPPAPVATPAPAPVTVAAQAAPRNANGETLAQAEAAVLAEVTAGTLGADALARHPLPPGTSTDEALRFLASLPQTTYGLGEPGGTVTGPPIDQTNPAPEPPVSEPVDGTTRSLESAYKPAGVVAQWREFVDVFKLTGPKRRSAVQAKLDATRGLIQ